MTDLLDPNRYTLIDNKTGEEIDVAIFVDSAKQSGWEKAYASIVGEYIDCAGVQATRVLAWLISARDGANLVLGSQSEIAEKSGVSASVAKKVISKLYSKKLIKKIRSGCYMVSPKMIRNGDTAKGAMLLRIWDESE